MRCYLKIPFFVVFSLDTSIYLEYVALHTFMDTITYAYVQFTSAELAAFNRMLSFALVEPGPAAARIILPPTPYDIYSTCVLGYTQYDVYDTDEKRGRRAMNSCVQLRPYLLGSSERILIAFIHSFLCVRVRNSDVFAARCWVYRGYSVPGVKWMWKIKEKENISDIMYVPIEAFVKRICVVRVEREKIYYCLNCLSGA